MAAADDEAEHAGKVECCLDRPPRRRRRPVACAFGETPRSLLEPGVKTPTRLPVPKGLRMGALTPGVYLALMKAPVKPS